MNGGGGASGRLRPLPERASPSAECCRRPHWLTAAGIFAYGWPIRGAASPAAPAAFHLRRRVARTWRAGRQQPAHAPVTAARPCSAPAWSLGAALPGSSGLIGFSHRSPGSGGRRITNQISVCVCVCALAWLATLHCNIASGEATETPWNRD